MASQVTTPRTAAGRGTLAIVEPHEVELFRAQVLAIEAEARAAALEPVFDALTSEDEVAHGEAWEPSRGGLGVCAYCDGEWPCRTQQAIDRLLAAIDALRERSGEV